jgi:hypothetical protein
LTIAAGKMDPLVEVHTGDPVVGLKRAAAGDFPNMRLEPGTLLVHFRRMPG